MEQKTYYGRKRELLYEEKRPIMGGKENYFRRGENVLYEEKRPIIGGKET